MVEYKDTLNLPHTAFEMRANLAVKEPRLLERWARRDLYGEIQRARAAAPLFLLHDGPPYANGTLHHGHILNKILKDIVIKDRTMAGFRAPYVPGWDCHGLPIEVQVDKELGARKAGLTKAQVHAACRDYAARFVDIQRQGFERLGVLGRWAAPYLTMNFAYEAAIVRELARLVDSGLVYKGLRPVNWCVVHQTALAEAEVEYDNHRSPSVYVAFPIVAESSSTSLPPALDVVIWTTTPWTLPANVAIALHPNFTYAAYPVHGRLRLVAQDLLPAFLQATGAPPYDASLVAGTWTGRALAGTQYEHVFMARQSPLVLGEHVTLEAGTGCVHTAPGHGADDFEVARQYGLAVWSGVNEQGKLTAATGPFAGMSVQQANPAIVEALRASGALLNPPDATIEHRYPHCWRCHKPIILRATEQWWVAMDKPFAQGPALRERALQALTAVTWVPHWGEDRIRGMLAGRPDWCLSRQRTWGVPLPIVYCEGCSAPWADAGIMEKVAQRVETEGAAAWFVQSVETLCGPLTCPHCGGHAFRKETDILDVWFDSGVSFAAVVEREKLGHTAGASVDLYLEGSDQHRGWFHSSLLCSLSTRQQPPYRTVLTHGFVVDGTGKKISKSKGNYLDPFKAIDKDGAELLRLWVACEDYRGDIRLSQEILTRLSDSYRKIRNTLRYLLGNLHDFVPQHHLVGAAQMAEVDQYAVALVQRATGRARSAYESYNFHVVMQVVMELCTADLSAFYLDMLKDRLYASPAASVARRSAQTALYVVAMDLIRLVAPILCFTAEEAWEHLVKPAAYPTSVHLAHYPSIAEEQYDPGIVQLRAALAAAGPNLIATYDGLRDARRYVNSALEEARRHKTLGSSVEAAVTLTLPEAAATSFTHWTDAQLAEFFIVSKLDRRNGPHMHVEVRPAPGTKCARCWLYRQEVGAHQSHPALCGRCVEAVSQ